MNGMFRLILCFPIFCTISSRLFFPTLDEEVEPYLFNGKKPERIKPIILIPGLGGSSLEAKLTNVEEEHWFCRKNEDWFLFWVKVTELIPYLGSDCFKFNLAIFFNNTSKSFYNHQGVSVRPKDYGGTGGVEYINPTLGNLGAYMHQTVEFFVSMGYIRGKSIRAANYDFRLGPQEWVKRGIFDQLKALVEETYEINDQEPVYLLGHSMGGPMGSYFLGSQVSDEWKKKYIGGYFSVAGSYDGGYDALGTMIYGKYDVIPVDIHDTTNRAGGVLWSIPYNFYPNEIVLYSKHKNYSIANIKELFEDMGKPDINDIFKYVTTDEVNPLKYPPGVKAYCMNGIGFKTPKALYYDDVKKQEKYKVVEWFEDGDGTVFPQSYRVCDNWKDQQKESVEVHNFKGLKYKNKDYHRWIVCDPEFLDKVAEILYG